MNDILYVGEISRAADASHHQRELWTLCLCTAGSGCFLFDEIAIPCQPGCLIVIPPDTPHAHQSDTGAAFLYLFVADAALAFRHPMLLEDDDNHSLERLFRDAMYHFGTNTPYRAALLPAYGQLIVQHISVRRNASPRSQLVEDIARNIRQNYANPNYELDALLRSAPYCYDYLCRLFRQELQTTPHKYLLELRMQSAAEALRGGSGSSVTEIARQCGYSDPLYFSRMFKRKFGLSPREYAKGK